MPRVFYPDTEQNLNVVGDPEKYCLNQIGLFDGPAVCMRPKGHEVTETNNGLNPNGEFHQEAFEGWFWDNHGRVG